MRFILKSINNKKTAVLEIHKACHIACAACIFAKVATKIHYSGIYVNRNLYCAKYKYFIYSSSFVCSNIHRVILFTSSLPYKVLI